MGTDFAEPHISSNPNDPLQYFNAFNINGTHRTIDGHEWQYFSPNFGTSVAGDPVTAYDSLGNLYYMNMYGSISGAKVIKSTDNGVTWGTPVTAVLGGDKCWLAADQTDGPFANYVYATMTNNSFTGHNFARSTDGGTTFNNTFTASNSPLPGAMVAVGPDVLNGHNISGGAVYFVTNSGGSFNSTYTFYRSTDGGSSFSLMSAQNFSGYVGTNVNGRNSVEGMRTRPYPFIAADNSFGNYRGRLYLVYASNNPAGNGNKPDIFCRYSDDQGASWSNEVVVNDDPNSQNNNQWHPSVWCDKENGRLYVKWMDTRDTPTSDSAYIYASYSEDGGQTFVQNQRISNKKMKINCSTCGGGGTPRYQGDYDAITSYGNVSMSVWTDFRVGQFGSYVGYFPDFALLTSPASSTIGNIDDSTFYTIEVPATTLYDQDAIFTASVNPTPASGNIDISFEPSNILSTFPGSLQMKISTSGNVTLGSYTINIEGKGPEGIPVHRRQVELVVQEVVPVELTMFNASVNKNNIQLNWSTATETNNRGYEIQRTKLINDKESVWEKIGFVEGSGNKSTVSTYSYSDKNIYESGNYAYRLKQLDFDGKFSFTKSVEVKISQPLNFELSQNYPNPFNPATSIRYSLAERSNVTIKVYDILGNEVRTLVNQQKPAGSYELKFDGSNLASGIYYYKLKQEILFS